MQNCFNQKLSIFLSQIFIYIHSQRASLEGAGPREVLLGHRINKALLTFSDNEPNRFIIPVFFRVISDL